MLISFILHNLKKCILPVFFFMVLVLPVNATEVLNIQINPSSPVYNQPFKCALTLDQDDHRNACDLLPLDAPADMEPWDICRIHHLSDDNLTRYYDCFVTDKQKSFVPGPGNYQIVVWNFTGDGETGQITARKNITIVAAPPPSPTQKPKPTSPPYIPPPTSAPTSIRTIPTSSIAVPNQKAPAPTSVDFSFPRSGQPSPTSSLITPFPQGKVTFPDITYLSSSLSAVLSSSYARIQASVFSPLLEVLSNFLKETHF